MRINLDGTPNFIEGGTFFGGLLKLRNTAEALVIVLAIGIPVFSVSALTLTAKIIILCLTALPLGIIALVGINGESLSSFIFLVLKHLHNRRVITRNEEEQGKRKKRKKRKVKGDDAAPKYINPVAEYLPVEKIENGIIYTRDHRYLKIVEVVPINFLLRSAREQRNIIYSFISFLKISPVKMQIKVIAKRADLNRHREIVQQEMAQETDENCRLLQQDYLTLIDRIGAREATTRRFFMVFEYEAWAGRKRGNEEDEAIASLQTAARTAVNYLKQCGNEVLVPENDDESSRQSVWIYSVTHCFMLRRVSRSESSPTRFMDAAITSSSLIATAFSHAACSASSLARCLASHSAFRLASACSCSCRLRSSSSCFSASGSGAAGVAGAASAFCCI